MSQNCFHALLWLCSVVHCFAWLCSVVHCFARLCSLICFFFAGRYAGHAQDMQPTHIRRCCKRRRCCCGAGLCSTGIAFDGPGRLRRGIRRCCRMTRAVQHRGFAASSGTKPARGGACFVPHLLIPPKSCIAFIADLSELARVEVAQQCFFPLPQIAQMSHTV